MLWNLIVDADKNESLSVSITVEAESWFNALREGLTKHGVDSRVLAHISCDVSPDKSVRVMDSLSNRVFFLKPVPITGEGNGKAPPESSDASPLAGMSSAAVDEAKSRGSVNGEGLTSSLSMEAAIADHVERTSETPSDQGKADQEAEPLTTRQARDQEPREEGTASPKGELPEHRVFFERDEVPDQALGIQYRERLIAASARLSKETLTRLARHYFDELRRLSTPEGTKLYITVHVYDHEFEKRAERPAMVALTWKEWRPGEPEVLFPLFGDEGVTISGKRGSSGAPSVSTSTAGKAKAPSVGPPPTDSPGMHQQESTKRRSGASSRGESPNPSNIDVDDRMIVAFERMQDIYSVRKHDRAAEFVLDLARRLIPCESGSAMLMSPGNFELYVAAAYGPVAEQLVDRKLSLTKGIVGFATRNGVLLRVSNPADDERFDENLDRETGYSTRSVLCAPVQYEGGTIGAVELLNSFGEDGFTEVEGNVLSYLCTSLAEYITVSLPSREADFTDREFLALEKKKRPVRKRLAAKGDRPKGVAAKGVGKGRAKAPSSPSRTAAVSVKAKRQKKAKSAAQSKKDRS